MKRILKFGEDLLKWNAITHVGPQGTGKGDKKVHRELLGEATTLPDKISSSSNPTDMWQLITSNCILIKLTLMRDIFYYFFLGVV